MSFIEILAAVGGLLIGYWLVSVFLSGAKQPPGDGDRGAPGADAPVHWSEVLGVPATAGRDEIAAAYKARISQYHPDKVATMADEIRDIAQRRSAAINVAYDEAMRRFQ